jgi:transposase
VLRSSVYRTAICDWHDMPRRLPVHIAPGNDEVLLSWLCRLSRHAELSPLAFMRRSFGIDPRAHPDWWRRPTLEHLSILSDRTGVSVNRLRDMTLIGWASARGDENAGRLRPSRILHGIQSVKHQWYMAVCPRCLVEEGGLYVRREWMIGWVAVCGRHGSVLAAHCPSCRTKLRSPSLAANVPLDVGRCRRCRKDLSAAPGDGGVPEPVLRLQSMLVAIKRAGMGIVPGLGPIDWETLVALGDLILSTLWVDTIDYARERLFAEIVHDLDLPRVRRLLIDWPTNYGTLVLLTWLFAEWPARLNTFLSLLRSPTIDIMLARFSNLTPALCVRLHRLWVDTGPRRPQRMEAWRQWLDNLPQSADDLGERALLEFHSGRNARMTALAMLREGKKISTAAKAARVQPSAVQRWLDIGMGYGLEAILAAPLRRSDLTEKQRQEIEAWIGSIRRSTSGMCAWRLEHAQQEIVAHCGLLLSLDAVHWLFSHHRSLRQRNPEPV